MEKIICLGFDDCRRPDQRKIEDTENIFLRTINKNNNIKMKNLGTLAEAKIRSSHEYPRGEVYGIDGAYYGKFDGETLNGNLYVRKERDYTKVLSEAVKGNFKRKSQLNMTVAHNINSYLTDDPTSFHKLNANIFGEGIRSKKRKTTTRNKNKRTTRQNKMKRK